VAEVVVADDGDVAAGALDGDPRLRVVRGPHRGLGANRNAALTAVRTSHVLFLDDDATLSPAFVRRWRAALERRSAAERERLIFTGGEQQGPLRVYPNEQSFLGHQRRPYHPGEPRRTVVMNAAVFPTSLFDVVRFDEQLVYGYDEVDLTTRAVAAGYAIAFDPEAVNVHTPSPVNRALYARHVEASRLYVTFKRYGRTEGSGAKAAAFAVLAPLHLLGSQVRAGGARGLPATAQTLRLAAAYARGRRR
jgi:GT2 family glycosyltransferase